MSHKKLILLHKKYYFYRIDFYHFLIIFYKIYVIHHLSVRFRRYMIHLWRIKHRIKMFLFFIRKVNLFSDGSLFSTDAWKNNFLGWHVFGYWCLAMNINGNGSNINKLDRHDFRSWTWFDSTFSHRSHRV